MMLANTLRATAFVTLFSGSAALGGEVCAVEGLGVPDGTVLLQLGAVDMNGGPVYRQCVDGRLGSPFTAASLPRSAPTAPEQPRTVTSAPASPAGQGQEAAVGAADLDAAVRRLLTEQPGLVAAAMQRAQEQQRQQAAAERNRRLAEMLPKVVESGISVGAVEADVTVVEWLDYGCPYCQQSEPGVRELLAIDPKVRVVFKEMPILGPSSVLAARVALAAREQGRYLDVHHALMEMKTGHGVDLKPAMIEEMVATLGLDGERLKRDMESPEVNKALAETRAEASSLGIQSTPTFAIGAEMVPMALTAEGLAAKVAEVRGKPQASSATP
ncbi:DsbA family protein (plasmid) [Azospirillum sp. HJ39]|uniref:DsbA family protein n=1 Tax=Azospirillum sp. HJ39 TaxID=3159496 RepID=UPI0035583464